MLSAYAMTIIEADWPEHVIRYVQYFWRKVEWVGRDRETDEVHDCVEH